MNPDADQQAWERLFADRDRLTTQLDQCRLERDALRAQLAACRDALEACRPLVKHRAVDGSPEADRVLDLIAAALDPAL